MPVPEVATCWKSRLPSLPQSPPKDEILQLKPPSAYEEAPLCGASSFRHAGTIAITSH